MKLTLPINNLGQVVGISCAPDTLKGSVPCQSFLDNRGVLTPISDPRATNGTFAYGINDAGQIEGVYCTASGNLGFVDTGGVFTTISVPGASYTYAYGNNEAGQIVGESCNASLDCQSFLDTGGVFTTISVPGANTSARGINDAWEIVGFYIPQPPPVVRVDDEKSVLPTASNRPLERIAGKSLDCGEQGRRLQNDCGTEQTSGTHQEGHPASRQGCGPTRIHWGIAAGSDSRSGAGV